MSIQIKTTEGILTLSNASDVRETGILCVRGHKGVTLGFMGPLPKGGWVVSETLADLEHCLVNTFVTADKNDLGIQEAAATVARTYGHGID